MRIKIFDLLVPKKIFLCVFFVGGSSSMKKINIMIKSVRMIPQRSYSNLH